MEHITIVAYGTRGDVRPGIALGQALKGSGYEVRLVVTQDFAREVDGTDLDRQLLPVNQREVMRRVSSLTNPLLVGRAIQAEISPALLAAGKALIEGFEETDALIVTEWLYGVSEGIARSRQIPLLNLSMEPRIRTREFAIPTMPAWPAWMPWRETYNLLSYDLARFSRWWSYIRDQNSLRRVHLKQPPLHLRAYRELIARTPSITLVSPYAVPRPADWRDHHYLTGFLSYEDKSWQPAKTLVDFLEDGDPPVYIGFGSMHDRTPQETTQIILEALHRSDQRGVLYSGWAELGQTDLPERVFRLDYAPHPWLFPRVSAAVHHAGAGTSAAALRAGTPSVPIPHSGDQPFWARRLYGIGAATQPLARKRLEPETLKSRIQEAISDPFISERASSIGVKIRSEKAGEAAVNAVENALLRYEMPEAEG